MEYETRKRGGAGAPPKDPALELKLMEKFEQNEKDSGGMGKGELLALLQEHDPIRFKNMGTTKRFLQTFMKRQGMTTKTGEKKRLKPGWEILLWEFMKRVRWVSALYEAPGLESRGRGLLGFFEVATVPAQGVGWVGYRAFGAITPPTHPGEIFFGTFVH